MKSYLAIIAIIAAFSQQMAAQENATQMTLAQAQEYAMKNAFQIKCSAYDAVIPKLNTEALL